MKVDLENKLIMVTGASSGIGKSAAMHLLEDCHAKVVAIGRSERKMHELYDAYGERCRIITYDLMDLEHIQDIYRQIDSKLDGLVHCAGLSPLMKIEDNDVPTMMRTYTTNLFAFIELVKFFAREEYSNQNAGIVAMSSIAADVASYRQSVYSSSKCALEQFVRCAAKELLPRNIRVNAIASGAVETEMLRDLEAQSPGLRERLEKYYPMGLIDPKEVAETIVWLLSDKAKHIDGSILRMDSGFFVNK